MYDKLNIAYKTNDKQVKLYIINKVIDYLFGVSEGKASKRVIDYIEDFQYIQASFMQLYGINLRKENLKWLEFQWYLNGCFETIDNPIKKIVNYRIEPLPKDRDRRRWLQGKKKVYRLEPTQAELNSGMKQMFNTLKQMAKR